MTDSQTQWHKQSATTGIRADTQCVSAAHKSSSMCHLGSARQGNHPEQAALHMTFVQNAWQHTHTNKKKLHGIINEAMAPL